MADTPGDIKTPWDDEIARVRRQPGWPTAAGWETSKRRENMAEGYRVAKQEDKDLLVACEEAAKWFRRTNYTGPLNILEAAIALARGGG